MKKIIVLLLLAFFYSCPVSAENHPVRVLLYHNVSASEDGPENPYVMPLSRFRVQMAWLKENGFNCLTVSDMFDAMETGGLPEKAAVITFDDGYPGVYTYAFPLMKEYGFPATEYLVAEKTGMPKNLTLEMIREMFEAGWEIGSHSMTHPDLADHDDLDTEICGSRELISDLTGIPLQKISSFAYPYGSADEMVMNKVWKCGYQTGGGLGQIPVDPAQNRFYFSRHPVTSDMTTAQFAALFDTGDVN